MRYARRMEPLNQLTAVEYRALKHLRGAALELRAAEIVQLKELGYKVKHVGKIRTLYER